MTYATVLALIDGRPGSESVMKAALGLGERFHALVELLHVEADPERSMPVLGEGMSGAAVAQLIESMQAATDARREEAENLYRRYCTEPGVPLLEADAAPTAGSYAVRFSHVVGLESEELVQRGRLCDLVVLARPNEPQGGVDGATLEAALFGSGRPVLLAPPQLKGAFGQAAAIAWDGSREASIATAAALPLLAGCKKLLILSARQSADAAQPSQLTNYLKAHGLSAKTWAFTPGGKGIGQELLAEATRAGADIIIMGAYGHSRFREMVLGGATRHVISAAEIPVLMAH